MDHQDLFQALTYLLQIQGHLAKYLVYDILVRQEEKEAVLLPYLEELDEQALFWLILSVHRYGNARRYL